MLRLIEAYFASAGQLDPSYRSPSFFVNRRAADALFRKRSRFRFQVIAQEIEFVLAILIGRMERGLAGWKREDQPATAGINGIESENIAEECPVRMGVFRINDNVCARNHSALQRKDAEILAGNEFSGNSKLYPISNNLAFGRKFAAQGLVAGTLTVVLALPTLSKRS
jgi:hypothetical protein